MAGVANTMRLSARLASRYAPRRAARREFTASAHERAAQNFTMPALSPTMTEGNIASWKVKEGDSFSAGDVLLEIETDKATMDVEAQDEGKLFKIMEGDGAKGVKVGNRIAVFAEEGDDLSSLEVPAEEKKGSGQVQEAQKEESSPSKEDRKDSAPAPVQQRSHESARPSAQGQGGKAQKQKYPLYPAVSSLLHQNGLSTADAESIPATGPSGRLLKGDVLAYLGRISKDYPGQSSARLTKLSHLDLSNIQLAKPAPKPDPPAQQAPATTPELPKETEIAVPISLSAVISTQKRIQDSLGIFLPLSTFIARASDLANEDLPRSRGKPTAEDLFNAVLGLDQVASSGSRGKYVPQISGISSMPSAPAKQRKKSDIIDLLAAPRSKTQKKATGAGTGALGISTGENVFSVVAATGEEGRATEYLARMKVALEKEPGRLVL